MANLNKVMLIGNLTRDPVMKSTPGGASVCELGMAVNRKYRSQQGEEREEVCYVDICFFGKLADVCSRCLRRGEPLFVEGRLRYESWTDKTTQKPRSRLSILGEGMQFLSRSLGVSQNREQPSSGAPGLPPPPAFTMPGSAAPPSAISSPAEAAAAARRLSGDSSGAFLEEESLSDADGIPF